VKLKIEIRIRRYIRVGCKCFYSLCCECDRLSTVTLQQVRIDSTEKARAKLDESTDCDD